MKQNIYFLDDMPISNGNGIGTYRNILIKGLSEFNTLRLTLISMNAYVKELQIINRDSYDEIMLPPIASGHWREHGSEICAALQTHIDDNDSNVFMLHYSPCANFVQCIRKAFPRSKITFTVHNQGWCEMLLGCRRLFKRIVIDNVIPKEVSKETADFLRNYYRQECDLYNLVDAVIALSEATANTLKHLYHQPKEKIYYIPNGIFSPTIVPRMISRQKARRKLNIKDDEKIVLLVGRPSRLKGTIATLKAIHLLKRKHTNFRFVLIGSMKGYADFWDDGTKVATSVICTGHISSEDLRLWYSAADAGILPSYSEQCSYAALEMMASGLTIVASDGNGLKEMFQNEENAFTAHIGAVLNTNAYARNLSQAISKALSVSGAVKNRMKRRNIELLNTKHSVLNMASAYRELFKNIQMATLRN